MTFEFVVHEIWWFCKTQKVKNGDFSSTLLTNITKSKKCINLFDPNSSVTTQRSWSIFEKIMLQIFSTHLVQKLVLQPAGIKWDFFLLFIRFIKNRYEFFSIYINFEKRKIIIFL